MKNLYLAGSMFSSGNGLNLIRFNARLLNVDVNKITTNKGILWDLYFLPKKYLRKKTDFKYQIY